MVNRWLSLAGRKPNQYTKFRVIDITENPGLLSNEIKKIVARELLNNFVISFDWLRTRFSKVEEERLIEFITNEVFPAVDAHFNPRQSMWGEVFTAITFKELKDFLIPLRKLRYKECRDKAMRGKADVVAAKINEDRLLIVFAETKTKIQYTPSRINRRGEETLNDKTLAYEAYNGLKENNIFNPEMVNYFAQKMYLQDEYDLANRFDRALIDPNSYDKHFEIFLIFERDKWNEEVLEYLEQVDLEIEGLEVNVILIDNLRQLIRICFELAPEVGKEIVYG